jgi:SAM-dependent methyltransferase
MNDATPSLPTTVTSYDEVPYESVAMPDTHPDRLAVVARLHGLEPAPPGRCRVLELGCSSGGNLLPMGEALPGSRFVGIDLSARQVAEGQQALAAAGLTNVELRHADILDVSPDWGRFDYIIAHGVYSWVPPGVRDKLLRVCRENLAPQGVAYVSYNTYPGWHLRGTVREMMRYHTRQFADPGIKTSQAMGLLEFVARAAGQHDRAYAQLLERELNYLRRLNAWYVYHDHLEDVNEPVYFHQFVDQAHARGLQYLAESNPRVMVPRLGPEFQQVLRRLAVDLIHLQQYLDYVTNRAFRRSLLVHAEARVDRSPSPAVLRDLFVASRARPVARVDPAGAGPAEFQTAGGRYQVGTPLVKAALLTLSEAWPRALPYPDLLDAARRRHGGPVAQDPASVAEDDFALASELLRAFFDGDAVEFHAHQPELVTQVGERPQVSPLNRYAAGRHAVVTTRWHEAVRLGQEGDRIAAALDGRHGTAELVRLIHDLTDQQQAPPAGGGPAATDPARREEATRAQLKAFLEGLARLGLLVG